MLDVIAAMPFAVQAVLFLVVSVIAMEIADVVVEKLFETSE